MVEIARVTPLRASTTHLPRASDEGDRGADDPVHPRPGGLRRHRARHGDFAQARAGGRNGWSRSKAIAVL